MNERAIRQQIAANEAALYILALLSVQSHNSARELVKVNVY